MTLLESYQSAVIAVTGEYWNNRGLLGKRQGEKLRQTGLVFLVNFLSYIYFTNPGVKD